MDTYNNRVLASVEHELGVDDFSGQWEDIERSVDEMVPVSGDVEAADLIVAASLSLDWGHRHG